jgi:uncharacterized membrane protein (DUF373 family)
MIINQLRNLRPEEMQKNSTPISNPASTWFDRNLVVRTLEFVQDLIVISLCFGLFGVMVLQLKEMFMSLLSPGDFNFHAITADILFVLILVELFRLLIIYLQEHRVSIGVAVEVSIVSVLREVIVRGVLETPWVHILSTGGFLLVLAVLLVVRVWIPPTFEGIDPEARIVQSYNSHNEVLKNELENRDHLKNIKENV